MLDEDVQVLKELRYDSHPSKDIQHKLKLLRLGSPLFLQDTFQVKS